MKTLRQIQTEAVRVARMRHGITQSPLNILGDIIINTKDLEINTNNRTRGIGLLIQTLRFLDGLGVNGDDALVMAEKHVEIERMRLE